MLLFVFISHFLVIFMIPKSPQFAELAGIIMGDGSIGIYSSLVYGKVKTQYRIKVTLNSIKDLVYSKYVSDLLLSIFGKSPRIYFRKKENTLDICLFGKVFVELLISEGFSLSPKWSRSIIPNSLLSPSLGLFVLRGYMDTDGCVCRVKNNGKLYPRIELKICPSPMQNQLISLMRLYGFTPQVSLLDRGKVRVTLAGFKNLTKWFSVVGSSNPRNLEVARFFLPSDI